MQDGRAGGPFREVCEGSAIHPFIIRELVTPFQSPSPLRAATSATVSLPSTPFLARALTPLSRRS